MRASQGSSVSLGCEIPPVEPAWTRPDASPRRSSGAELLTADRDLAPMRDHLGLRLVEAGWSGPSAAPLLGVVAVTSKGLCQGEGGGEALVAVFVDEDGEQDAFHGGLVLEGAHGPGAPADLAEAALDRVGGAHRLALLEARIAEAGEQVVEVGAHAGDRLGIGALPAIGESPCGGPG